MKKFLSCVLISVLLCSTFLFCGFSSPIVDPETPLKGTPIETSEDLLNLYINNSIGGEYLYDYFSTYNLDQNETIDLITFSDADNNLKLSYYVNNDYGVYHLTAPYIENSIDVRSDYYVYYSVNNDWSFYVNDSVVSIDKGVDEENFDNIFSSTQYEIPLGYSIKGTALPQTTSVVNEVYLNTFMSPADVVAVLDTIDWQPLDLGDSIISSAYCPGKLVIDYEGVEVPIYYVFYKSVLDTYSITFNTINVNTFEPVELIIFGVDDLGNYIWDLEEYNFLDQNPIFNPFGSGFSFESLSINGVEIPSFYANDSLSSLISTTPFEIKETAFVTSLLDVLGAIFISYPLYLVEGIIGMFSGLFWTGAELTILAKALVVFGGMCLVGSIFKLVYTTFKGTIRKRL